MKKDTYKTKVIFRKFKDGDIIALMPWIISDHRGNCESYMHIGQHGGADYFGLLSITKLATKKEYAPLAAELRSIGYNLDIRQRYDRRASNDE